MGRSESVSIWQASLILFFILFANKILLLPSLMFKEASFEGVFGYIALFFVELLLITVFVFLKKRYPNSSFSALIREKFGKATMFFVYFLFCVFFLFKVVLIYNVTYIFFKDLIYKENNNFLYLCCFLPVVSYLAYMGLRTLGRTCQIFSPFLLLMLLFCTVLAFAHSFKTPPLFQGDFVEVGLVTLKHLSAFGDAIFLFVFMDKINFKKGDGKVLYLTTALAFIIILLIVIAFYLSYTFTAFLHPFAIFEVLGNIRDYGGLGRVDAVSMVLIMLLTYFQIAIYLTMFAYSFCSLFPRLSRGHAIATFDFLFIIFDTLFVHNLEKTVFYAENYLPYFSVVPFVIVPLCSLVLIIISCYKDKGKNE